jgi:hypothetical protein
MAPGHHGDGGVLVPVHPAPNGKVNEDGTAAPFVNVRLGPFAERRIRAASG